MGIRLKILFGFLVLSLMLLIAGLWSIYELNSIGSSVQNILDDNYESIHAAKVMKEALEREDSAILLLLLGKWEEGRAVLASADSLFEAKFKFASMNITIPGEKEHLESIKSKYITYKKLCERPIVGTNKEGNLDWYFQEVYQSFLSVKESVNELINLNNKIMYQTATDLENRSNRAIMPGIIAIISALVFTFIFTYLINYYIVGPIIRITDGIKKFKEKRTPFDVKIETKDEIYYLAEAIEHLCLSVKNQDS
jgi:NtrC-family two-component system sensor histidine kinase KinB